MYIHFFQCRKSETANLAWHFCGMIYITHHTFFSSGFCICLKDIFFPKSLILIIAEISFQVHFNRGSQFFFK